MLITPWLLVQRNQPALLDHEVLKRAESLCRPPGLCSWDDHDPICCDSPPGNILGARDDKSSLQERGRAESPAPFEKDDSDGEEVVDTDENAWAYEAVEDVCLQQILIIRTGQDAASGGVVDLGTPGTMDDSEPEAQLQALNQREADPKEQHHDPEEWYLLPDDEIHIVNAMSGKPIVKSHQGRCWFLRTDFPDNCTPLRKKDGFDWDLFLYCYTKKDCPPKSRGKRDILSGQKRFHFCVFFVCDGYAMMDADVDLNAASGPEQDSTTSELDPRMRSIWMLIPSKEAQDEARKLHKSIPDNVQLSGDQCWVLGRFDNSNCRAILQDGRTHLSMTAFHDCYHKQKCLGKRDLVPIPVQIKERTPNCNLSKKRPEWLLQFKPDALLGEEHFGAAETGCFFRKKWGHNLCGRLTNGDFSRDNFWACYEIVPHLKSKRDALPEPDYSTMGKPGMNSNGCANPGDKEMPSVLGNAIKLQAVSFVFTVGRRSQYPVEMDADGRAELGAIDKVEERAFVPSPPFAPRKPRCQFGEKLAPKKIKRCMTSEDDDCVERKGNKKNCHDELYYEACLEVVLEQVCKSHPNDSANNPFTQIHLNACGIGYDVVTENGKSRVRCKDSSGRLRNGFCFLLIALEADSCQAVTLGNVLLNLKQTLSLEGAGIPTMRALMATRYTTIMAILERVARKPMVRPRSSLYSTVEAETDPYILLGRLKERGIKGVPKPPNPEDVADQGPYVIPRCDDVPVKKPGCEPVDDDKCNQQIWSLHCGKKSGPDCPVGPKMHSVCHNELCESKKVMKENCVPSKGDSCVAQTLAPNCTPSQKNLCVIDHIDTKCRRIRADLSVEKRDRPAVKEYFASTNFTSAPPSDIILNYLKCKDFCKFDVCHRYPSPFGLVDMGLTNGNIQEASPPTCLPNCYVIDGKIQLDAPGILMPPPASATASNNATPTTLQTSTASAMPTSTLLADGAGNKKERSVAIDETAADVKSLATRDIKDHLPLGELDTSVEQQAEFEKRVPP
ncbi:MAG: hypothetical protein Q9168_004864, partial [Polycauliona sp. 1 TL-2023]